MRKCLWLFLFTLWSLAASAQTTTVTATVVDSDTTVWANANVTWRYSGVAPGTTLTDTRSGQSISTTSGSLTLNSSGAMSLAGIVPTQYINPKVTGLSFTVCTPFNVPNCYTSAAVSVGIASPQNVSSTINAAILAPRISGGVTAQAYADVEVQAINGNQYYNVILKQIRSYQDGVWTALGAGSSVSILVTDPPYNAKCDGDGAGAGTDDTAALQAALDHGGVINLPPTIGDPLFIFPVCNFSGNLQVPLNATLQGNGSGLYWTGTSGVGLTLNAGAYLINGYIQATFTGGPITGIESTSSVHISGWSSWGPPSGNVSWISYNASKIQESFIDGLTTDGPVIMSQDLAIPGLAGMVHISNSNIGSSPRAAYPAMLSIDPATSGVWSFTSVWIYSTSTSNTACAICVTNSTTGQSPIIQFNNVKVKTLNTYTGSLLKTSQTGIGALPPWIAGSIDTSDFAAGTLFSGNWLGQLQVGATTYRGNAAIPTYRCLTAGVVLPAGSITTDSTKCGSSTLTGDTSN